MHQHGPNELAGPVRGTAGWWQGMTAETDQVEGPPVQPPTKKTRKTRKDARPIRQDLVDRIRKEIAAGTYDTEEKWQAALERLLERLDGD
jgi:hypothetical protein